MITLHRRVQLSLAATITAFAFVTAGCSPMHSGSSSAASTASLTGSQEDPANTSPASGTSTIKIDADKSISGMVTVSGMTPTAAHIHAGAKGTNGPVVIPLTQTSDTTFSVPANTKLTDEQYALYKQGNLYINVHSAAFAGGEVRTQLSPK